MEKKKERTVTVNYEELDYSVITDANPNILKVRKNNVDFYFKIKLKEDNNNMVVFSNGAYNPQKSTPPIFARSSWHSDFDANCIFIDDVTIHGTECTLGWGVGTPEHYYLESFSIIVKKIGELLNVPERNTVYFGSSAGGFMSMMLATLHKGSLAVPNNPQVYAHKFGRGVAINKLYDTRFSRMNEDEIHENYGERFSVLKMMVKKNFVPKTIYLINRFSDEDIEKQYKPFIQDLKENNLDISNIEFIFYHAEKGHEGIYSREKSAGLVNAYLKGFIR